MELSELPTNKLNKKQVDFLFLINKETNKCIRKIGRTIYRTDVSCYNVRNRLLSKNLIYLENIKKREIPHLTKKGKIFLAELATKVS